MTATTAVNQATGSIRLQLCWGYLADLVHWTNGDHARFDRMNADTSKTGASSPETWQERIETAIANVDLDTSDLETVYRWWAEWQKGIAA